MPSREQILEINSEQVDLQRRGISNASTAATITVAGDTLAPAAPSSVSANSVPDGVKIEWTNPSLNEDGTTCVDQRWALVHYKSSSPVAASDPSYVIAAKAGANSAFVDSNVGTGTTVYYVVTAMDGNGNESAISSEVSADGGGTGTLTEIPDDASGLVFKDTVGTEGIVVGDGVLGIAFKQPASTWSNFDHYRLWFAVDGNGGFGAWTEITPTNRIGYLHKGLTKTSSYRYKATIVAADGTESSTPDKAKADDSGYTPNGSANNLLIAELIFAENLICVNEVRGEHFFAQSYLAINDTTFGNDGIQLEYNSGNPRAYIGDGANAYVQFDGTTLSASSLVIGANSSWGGNVLGTAYIPNLSAAKITTGTMVANRISGGTIGACTISASNITTGSMSAARITTGTMAADRISSGTIGACTISANNITTGTLNCSLITVSNLSASSITTGTLSATYISGGTLNCSLMTVSNLSASSISTGTLSAGYISGGTLDCSLITVSNLSASSITTGTLSASYISGGTLNCSLMTVSNLSASSISTGTLSASYISAGTLDCSLMIVSNLSASSITTGTLSATYISGGTLDFAAISKSALLVIASEIDSGAVTYGKIGANAVRIAELYIDGDVNFIASGDRKGLYGCDFVRWASTAGGSGPRIEMTSANLYLYDDAAGGDLTINVADDVFIIGGDQVLLKANSLATIITVDADITLSSSDDIILDVADAASPMYIKDWQTTGGAWGSGWAKVIIGGVTRYILLDDSV